MSFKSGANGIEKKGKTKGKNLGDSGPTVKKGNPMDELKISVAGISKGQLGEKTDGIKIRGTGAATKGTMARGPMA